MSRNARKPSRWIVLPLVLIAGIAFSVPAFAEPPSHAPAHGWRKKHDQHHYKYKKNDHEDHHQHGGYVGYSGHRWPRDYGTRSGRCNRDEIGTVLGGVVGGAIGSTIGSGSDRVVAIVVGGVLGAVIGHEIGREMDERDRACVGQSLELVGEGHSVRWLNESSGVSYVVTPLGGKTSGDCRSFNLVAARGGKSRASERRACRGGDGVWRMH